MQSDQSLSYLNNMLYITLVVCWCFDIIVCGFKDGFNHIIKLLFESQFHFFSEIDV